MKSIDALEQDINQGYRLNYEQAVELCNTMPFEQILELAGRLRKSAHGNYFDTCSIMNARSGRCSEDCKWCSQSKFHDTHVDIYPLVSSEEALEQARHNAAKGIKRFSLVTSGRTMSGRDMERTCEIYRKLRGDVDIKLCASLGLLTQDQMQQLRDSGVSRYHCNLESAPSFFPTLCTTHTTAEKIQTLRWAQQAGMKICSGGIIGMGESMEQRIELAVALQGLGVDSIPVNVLNPIKGTPLANVEPLSDREVLLTAAMMRIVNPNAHIRLAGGRTLIEHLIPQLLHCGVSAMILGDMLTTVGSKIDQDKELISKEGFLTTES